MPRLPASARRDLAGGVLRAGASAADACLAALLCCARRDTTRRRSIRRSSRLTTRRSRGRASSPSPCRCTPRCVWACASPSASARLNPSAHICFYGLYASLNRGLSAALRRRCGDRRGVRGGAARAGAGNRARRGARRRGRRPRGRELPRRCSLACRFPARARRAAGPSRYARLVRDGRSMRSPATSRRAAAACIPAATARSRRSTAAASSSCRARSCWRTSARRSPPAARHITFGDPDFLNGPGHSLAIARALHAEFPEVDLRRDDQGRAHSGAARRSSLSWRAWAASSSSRRSSR